MLRKKQIQGFFIIASCCFAIESANFADLLAIGDASAKEKLFNLKIVQAWLDTIDNYDPVLTDNCLSYDQIYSLIQKIAKKLCICSNLNQIPSA